MPGVDTVAVPDFDIGLLGHSYFAQALAPPPIAVGSET
jgi:hypothetical protein